MKALPKPGAITPKGKPTQCITCRHPWAPQWIEDALVATHGDGHPRPATTAIHAAITAYWEENGEKHALAQPPTFLQIDAHVRKHGHARGWFLWD